MNKVIAIINMPKTCCECFFCCTIEEIPVGNGLYKKVGKCSLAKDVEDPWRDIHWLINHKESWCPLKPIPEKYDIEAERNKPHDMDYSWDFEGGYNQCIDEILGTDEM